MTMPAVSRAAIVVGGALGKAEQALTRLGFSSVERAATIDAAIELLRGRTVDLVVVPVDAGSERALTQLDAEARKSGRTFLIGTAPRLDSDLILRAMRSGVHEFLVQPAQESELAAAIDRLMRRAAAPGALGQLLTVYSAKGGLGCTTIAVNLATTLAATTKKRVALIDLVLADGDARVFLSDLGSYNLTDLAAKLDHADQELVQSLLSMSNGVAVLPSPENPELDDQIDAQTTERVLQRLRAHYDYVIADVEHHMGPRTLAALDASDRIIVVTQLSVVALRSTQRTLGVFRELGYADDKAAVVVNRFLRGDVLGRRDATQVLTREVFHTLPNDFERANAALTRGVPIAVVAADSKLSSAYGELATMLSGNDGSVRPLPVKNEGEALGIKRLFRRSKQA